MIEHNPAQISTRISGLFPAGVSAAESLPRGQKELIYLEEIQYVEKSSKKRVEEFSAGRLCARRALRAIGIENFPLHVGPDRRPVWPAHCVGSITHTAGFCAAAVAPRSAFASLGIDSERADAVGRDVWEQISTASEFAMLESLDEAESSRAAALLFAAKEAFYKCQFGITQEWLDFADVALVFDGRIELSGQVAISPQRPMRIFEAVEPPMRCRFLFHDEFVSVGAAVPACGDRC